jgi:hypothetical protein
MKIGDKIKFHRWSAWEDTCGISKFIFEKEYSYDKIYTVTVIDDLDDESPECFGIESTPTCYGFVHDFRHAYIVNEYELPEELFTL